VSRVVWAVVVLRCPSRWVGGRYTVQCEWVVTVVVTV